MPPAVKVHHGMRERSRFFTGPDDHSYHFNRVMKGGRWSLTCVFTRTRRCHGRSSMLPDGRRFKETQRHNHRPDRGLLILRRLKRSVLRRCQDRDNTAFKLILSQEIVRLRVPLRFSALLPYKTLRPAMIRARLKSYPPMPTTLRGLFNVLTQPQNRDITATKDGIDNILASSAGHSRDRSRCVIFTSERMKRYMRRVSKVFVDATYDSVPACLRNDCKQVWNFSTTWRHHSIPLVRILMQGKSESAYTAGLQELRRSVPDFNPRVVMADFDPTEFQAWHQVFPNWRRKGCIFHYVQRIGRKCRKMQLVDLVTEDDSVEEVVKSMCALPLLPRHLLARGFRVICRLAQRTGEWNSLRPLFIYHRRTWMTHERRRVLSVYKSSDRTNNVSESNNNQLRIAVHNKHLNLWVFIDGLRDMKQQSWLDLGVLRHGGNPSRKRRADSIVADERIAALTYDLDAGRISLRSFLRRTSYAITNAYMKGLNGER